MSFRVVSGSIVVSVGLWLLDLTRLSGYAFAGVTDAEARDRNFAVHLPVIDRLFGTHHLPPGRWPERYGADGEAVPPGWVAQLVWPLRRPEA